MFKNHFDSNPYQEIGLIISLLTDVRRISYAGYSTKKKKNRSLNENIWVSRKLQRPFTDRNKKKKA